MGRPGCVGPRLPGRSTRLSLALFFWARRLWLASSDLQLQQTANCPHNVRQEPSRSDARQTQETPLRCTPRQFHRDTQPAITIPSSFALPPSQRLSPWASITHNASPTVLRLQFSERNVFSTASLGLDPRSTSQLRSRIGCLQACRAGLLSSSSCPPGQAGPLRANWYRNLTLSNLLVCQALRP